MSQTRSKTSDSMEILHTRHVQKETELFKQRAYQQSERAGATERT